MKSERQNSTDDSLARLVRDYIRTVVAAVDAINAGQTVDASGLHARLTARLRNGAHQAPDANDWKIASYALAAWTDELLLDAAWDGSALWRDQVLEVELFGTRECGERFFELAAEVSRTLRPELLRVFRDCVLLGFRGLYAHPQAAAVRIAARDWPPTCDAWLVEVQQRLAVAEDSRGPTIRHRVLGGIAPTPIRRDLVWWSIAAGLLLIVNLALTSFPAG